jgi:hypothetical protein
MPIFSASATGVEFELLPFAAGELALATRRDLLHPAMISAHKEKGIKIVFGDIVMLLNFRKACA